LSHKKENRTIIKSTRRCKNGKKENSENNLYKFYIVDFFLVGSMIFVAATYQSNFPRYDKKEYSGYLKYSDVKDSYNRTAVSFQSGDNTLKGYVYGEGSDKGLVIIAPGRGTSQEEYLPETLFFVDKGWRVLTFDITGSFDCCG